MSYEFVRDLAWDLKNLIGNYRARRDEVSLGIEKLLVKRDEYTARIGELEALLDKHKMDVSDLEQMGEDK